MSSLSSASGQYKGCWEMVAIENEGVGSAALGTTVWSGRRGELSLSL